MPVRDEREEGFQIDLSCDHGRGSQVVAFLHLGMQFAKYPNDLFADFHLGAFAGMEDGPLEG